MKKSAFLFPMIFLLFCNSKSENKKVTFSQSNEINVNKEKVFGIGPNGEKPSTIDELKEKIKNIKVKSFENKNYSIIIAMHDVENDWSQTVLSGIKNTLAQYGLKISLITDGEFNVEKQVSDYKQIIKLNPDILITITVDSKKTSSILQKIEKNGTQIIFIDALPNGFITGKNCIGLVIGDSYTMGKAGAEMLISKVNENSNISMLNWKNEMYTVDRRSEGARKVFENSKEINFDELYFENFHEIKNIIKDKIMDSIKISGFWAVWDAPALEILNVLNENNYDASIVTADLSKEIAIEISKKNSKIIGTVADDPYSIGSIEAMLAVAALSKIKVSGYYVTPVIKVDRRNLEKAWKHIYRYDLPADIKANLN